MIQKLGLGLLSVFFLLNTSCQKNGASGSNKDTGKFQGNWEYASEKSCKLSDECIDEDTRIEIMKISNRGEVSTYSTKSSGLSKIIVEKMGHVNYAGVGAIDQAKIDDAKNSGEVTDDDLLTLQWNFKVIDANTIENTLKFRTNATTSQLKRVSDATLAKAEAAYKKSREKTDLYIQQLLGTKWQLVELTTLQTKDGKEVKTTTAAKDVPDFEEYNDENGKKVKRPMVKLFSITSETDAVINGSIAGAYYFFRQEQFAFYQVEGQSLHPLPPTSGMNKLSIEGDTLSISSGYEGNRQSYIYKRL